LSGCNVTRAKSVEVTEEFGDANTLLLALHANASDNIVNVIRTVANNLSVALSGLSLREVGGAVVESLVDTKELFSAIDVLTEVDIVDLVNVSLVHVTLHERLQNVMRSSDSEQIQHSQELVLGHMAIFGDVVVLKHWLEMDALVFNGSFVLIKDVVDFISVLGCACKVLSTSQKGVVLGNGGNSGGWSLVNSLDGESRVDVGNEVSVAEESLRVVGLVLLSQSLELVIGQNEVEGRQD